MPGGGGEEPVKPALGRIRLPGGSSAPSSRSPMASSRCPRMGNGHLVCASPVLPGPSSMMGGRVSEAPGQIQPNLSTHPGTVRTPDHQLTAGRRGREQIRSMDTDGASVCQVDIERTERRLVPHTDDSPNLHGNISTFRQACLQVRESPVGPGKCIHKLSVGVGRAVPSAPHWLRLCADGGVRTHRPTPKRDRQLRDTPGPGHGVLES
jgi:hypothetical protein